MATDTPTPDKLLSSRKVAEMLGVSTVTLSRWRCEQTGPAYVRLAPCKVGYTTVTTAQPKVGKSRLSLVEAVDMVTGRGLLGGGRRDRLRVAYLNLEDEQDVIDSCVSAILTEFDIAQSEIAGRLFATSGVGTEWHLIGGENGIPREPEFAGLSDFVRGERIDALIFDPLQDLSYSPETNEVFRSLGRRLRRFASENNVAVGLVHHTRKPSRGVDLSLDDMRGGSALRGTARFNRILAPMDENDAAKVGVEDHRRYFRIAESESNLAPPSSDRNRWFEKRSVLTLAGYHVGVVVPWTRPEALDGVEDWHAAQVRARIAARPNPPRANAGANDWVGHIVAQVLGWDAKSAEGKARIKSVLSAWIKHGYLAEERRFDPVSKRESPCIVIGSIDPTGNHSVL